MGFLNGNPLRRLRGQEKPLPSSNISDLETQYRNITQAIMENYGEMARLQVSSLGPVEKQRQMLIIKGQNIFLRGEQQVVLLRLKAAYRMIHFR